MGEVINISRVSDLDILSEFDAQCPSIPQDLDAAIRHGAENAVAKRQGIQKPGSFRVACAAVVLLSLVAVAWVKFIASQVSNDGSLHRYNSGTAYMNKNWRESRESWQAYINHLQNNPLMVHLRVEQELFQQQYPD